MSVAKLGVYLFIAAALILCTIVCGALGVSLLRSSTFPAICLLLAALCFVIGGCWALSISVQRQRRNRLERRRTRQSVDMLTELIRQETEFAQYDLPPNLR